MESTISPLTECRNKLSTFTQTFQDIESYLQTLFENIESDTTLIDCAKGVIPKNKDGTDSDTYVLIDSIAKEIGTNKSALEEAFKYYSQDAISPCSLGVLNNEKEAPRFQDWLNAISTLEQIFWRYDRNTDHEQSKVLEIQHHVKLTLDHLKYLSTTLKEALCRLQSIKKQLKAEIQPHIAKMYSGIQNVCSMDFSEMLTMDKLIPELYKSNIARHAVIITKHPRHVIMKSKKDIGGTDRNISNRTTRTDISVKILNLEYSIAPISVKIELVNQCVAKNLLPSGLPPQSTDSQTEIYAHTATATPRGSNDNIVSNVQNFDKYIKTGVQAEEIMNNERNTSIIFAAKTDNISVQNVGKRRKRDSNGKKIRVITDKFYFLISTELQTNFIDDNFSCTAWALSTPMIVRTYSSHTSGAFATTSWDKYFSGIVGNSKNLREHARDDEIKHVLQQHFNEWTAYNVTGGSMKFLSLSESHLESLLDILLQDISEQLNMDVRLLTKQIPLDYFYYLHMQDKEFSYFTWFYKSTELLKQQYFRNLWIENKIIGFIGINSAFELLRKNGCNPGNFLIKFSQSEEATLTAVFVDKNREFKLIRFSIDKYHQGGIQRAFLSKMYDSNIWSCTGMKQNHDLVTLYPNIPKEKAFPRDQTKPINSYISAINFIIDGLSSMVVKK